MKTNPSGPRLEFFSNALPSSPQAPALSGDSWRGEWEIRATDGRVEDAVLLAKLKFDQELWPSIQLFAAVTASNEILCWRGNSPSFDDSYVLCNRLICNSVMIFSVFEPLSRALCKVCELRWHLQLPLPLELVAGSTHGMEKPENSARRDVVLLVQVRLHQVHQQQENVPEMDATCHHGMVSLGSSVAWSVILPLSCQKWPGATVQHRWKRRRMRAPRSLQLLIEEWKPESWRQQRGATRRNAAANSPVFGCQKRQCLLSVLRIATFVCSFIASTGGKWARILDAPWYDLQSGGGVKLEVNESPSCFRFVLQNVLNLWMVSSVKLGAQTACLGTLARLEQAWGLNKKVFSWKYVLFSARRRTCCIACGSLDVVLFREVTLVHKRHVRSTHVSYMLC